MSESRLSRNSLGTGSDYGVASPSQNRPTSRSMTVRPASTVPEPSKPGTLDIETASILRTGGGDIEINDGQFNAVAGSHISVTINAGCSKIRESQKDTKDGLHQLESPRKSTPGDRENELPILPTQSSWETYYRHLGAKGRGSPLWIPGPNKNLHIDYQRNGIAVGDVGIITFDGDLPEIFTTVNMAPRDIRKYTVFRGESYLSSAAIKKSQQEGGVSGLIFESSASEGAVLAMPAGSSSVQLLNVGLFRKWLTVHAEELYRYANDTCGREAKNGDIRLVTGFDKTTKWGMAAFSNSSASTKDSSLLLKFRPLDSNNDLGTRGTYGWEYSGMAEVRAGPDRQEIEELRSGDPSEEQMEYENQCLFLRTLNVTLQERIWKKLSSEGEILVDNGSTFQPPLPSDPPPGGQSSRYTSNSQSTYFHESHIQRRGITQNTGVRYVYSTFPTAMSGHPCTGVNEILLKANPDTHMAIIDDTDWISVLKKSDHVVPSTQEILVRLEAAFVLRKEGLERGHLPRKGSRLVSSSALLALGGIVPISRTDSIFPDISSSSLRAKNITQVSPNSGHISHIWKPKLDEGGSNNLTVSEHIPIIGGASAQRFDHVQVNEERQEDSKIRKGKGKEREVVILSSKPTKTGDKVNTALEEAPSARFKRPSATRSKPMTMAATSEKEYKVGALSGKITWIGTEDLRKAGLSDDISAITSMHTKREVKNTSKGPPKVLKEMSDLKDDGKSFDESISALYNTEHILSTRPEMSPLFLLRSLPVSLERSSLTAQLEFEEHYSIEGAEVAYEEERDQVEEEWRHGREQIRGRLFEGIEERRRRAREDKEGDGIVGDAALELHPRPPIIRKLRNKLGTSPPPTSRNALNVPSHHPLGTPISSLSNNLSALTAKRSSVHKSGDLHTTGPFLNPHSLSVDDLPSPFPLPLSPIHLAQPFGGTAGTSNKGEDRGSGAGNGRGRRELKGGGTLQGQALGGLGKSLMVLDMSKDHEQRTDLDEIRRGKKRRKT